MNLFNKSIKKPVWALTKFLKMDSFMLTVLKALELIGELSGKTGSAWC